MRLPRRHVVLEALTRACVILALMLAVASPVALAAGEAPPPRTVDDVLAVLDNQKPDPAKVAQLQAKLRAEPPPGLAPAEQARQYMDRALAADELGLYKQHLADAQHAYQIAKENGLTEDALDYRRQVAIAEQTVGNLREAGAIYDELIALYEQPGSKHRGRLFGLYSLNAGFAATRGDFPTAERNIAKAEALYEESSRWMHGAPFAAYGDMWRTQIARGQAQLAEARGRLDDALKLYREAQAGMGRSVAKATGSDDPNMLPLIQIEGAYDALGGFIARVLVKQNQLMEAEIEARRVLTSGLQRRGRWAPETAQAIRGLADVIGAEGRLREAGKLFKAAVETLEGSGVAESSLVLVTARTGYARSLFAEGRLPEALDQFERARRGLSDDPTARLRLVEGYYAYDMALVRSGRAAEAIAFLNQAVERNTAVLGAASYAAATARGYRGMALSATGDKARALADFDAALPVLLSTSRGSDDEEAETLTIRGIILRNLFEAYLATLSDVAGTPLAAGRDIVGEGFRLADAIRGQAVQRALAESSARAAARDPALADLARREQDAGKQIAALYQLVNQTLAAPPEEQDANVVRALRAQIDAQRNARAAARQEIERRFPAYAELIDPRPATIAEVQAALLPGEALVATYVAPDRSYVWAVPKQGAPAFAAPKLGRAAVAEIVAGLRRSLDPNASTLQQIPGFDLIASHRLYTSLLEPVKAGWANAHSLIVVPHGPLGQIPFSVLVTETPPPLRKEGSAEVMFASYKTVPFLIRQAAITQLPSVTSLTTLRAVPPAPAGRQPFIGFGDPYFSPAEARAAKAAPAGVELRGVIKTRGIPLHRRSAPATQRAESATLAQLPRLPDTAEEVRSVALALRADPTHDVLLGAAANEQSVLTADLAHRRVVMFATHGLVPGDLDGLDQPALALSAPSVAHVAGDGLLRMSAIVTLKLNADWVVLSACNTAAAEGAGAEAVSGLGRAFIYAGTRAVLVSNWPVETTSARLLTSDIFRRQAADPRLSRAEALRQAELGLIDGEGAVDPATHQPLYAYAHPIFWAPFSLVGDGG